MPPGQAEAPLLVVYCALDRFKKSAPTPAVYFQLEWELIGNARRHTAEYSERCRLRSIVEIWIDDRTGECCGPDGPSSTNPFLRHLASLSRAFAFYVAPLGQLASGYHKQLHSVCDYCLRSHHQYLVTIPHPKRWVALEQIKNKNRGCGQLWIKRSRFF